VISLPTRPAFALAIDACTEFGRELSASQAAWRVIRYAASQSASIARKVAAAATCSCAGRS